MAYYCKGEIIDNSPIVRYSEAYCIETHKRDLLLQRRNYVSRQESWRDFKFITRNLIKKIKIACHRNHYRVFFFFFEKGKDILFTCFYFFLPSCESQLTLTDDKPNDKSRELTNV